MVDSCWLVVSVAFQLQMSANLLKTSSLILAAAGVVITSFPRLTPHSSTEGCSAQATVVLLRSILTTHNPSPWVPSPFASESSAQQRVRSGERGAGKGSSFRVQGSLASSLSSLSWQFPPSTWPISTLNPSRSVWIFGSGHTCHFSAAFFQWGLWMSNFVRSHCCVSFENPALCLLWLCLLKIRPCDFVLLFPSFHITNTRLAVWDSLVQEVCLFHQVLLFDLS